MPTKTEAMKQAILAKKMAAKENPTPKPDRLANDLKAIAEMPVPPVAASKQPQARKKPKRLPFRLPDGATFTATFDAEQNNWNGTLTIPPQGEEPQLTFRATTSGIHGLFMVLGQRWNRRPMGKPALTTSAPVSESEQK